MTQKNAIEEIGIRMKDFQEVTFFTTRNGRPLPAISGIVSFLKPEDWDWRKRPVFNFMHPDAPASRPLDSETEKDSCTSGDGIDSAYRFMEGTPLSFFHSSAAVSRTEPKKKNSRCRRRQSRREANLLMTYYKQAGYSHKKGPENERA